MTRPFVQSYVTLDHPGPQRHGSECRRIPQLVTRVAEVDVRVPSSEVAYNPQINLLTGCGIPACAVHNDEILGVWTVGVKHLNDYRSGQLNASLK